MAPERSSRKADQKGVEAIFSPSKELRQSRLVIGVVVLSAGISFIIVNIIMVHFPNVLGRSPVESYGSLGFASIGVFTLTCGAGIIMSGFQLQHSPSSLATLGDNSFGSKPVTGKDEDTSSLPSSDSSGPNLRLVFTVFAQGSILLSLYTGLVEEYQSNPTMQAWVRSSLDNAQYLLNWGSLLVGAFLVGVLVVYSLVTKDPAN